MADQAEPHTSSPKTPPPGATWEGTAEDVADRLDNGFNNITRAYSNALGAIGSIVRSRGMAPVPAEQRLAFIGQVLDGLDLVEQRVSGGES